MQFIKNNFISVICLFVVAVMMFQRFGCNTSQPLKPTITTKTDTIWKTKDSIITKTDPTIYKSIPYKGPIKDSFLIPDTNYAKLKIQFDSLRDLYLTENIYKSNSRYDSSYVDLTDTVFMNRIKGRSLKFHLNYPVITKTITIKEPYIPVRQVYIGGSINGNPNSLINMADVGLLYKTKTDRIFEAKVGMDITGKINYGVGTFWKIHL